jgi:hypothetical protein
VDKWNSRFTIIIGILTIGGSLVGGLISSGIMYGKITYAQAMIIERLDRHVVQIKDSEKRHDASELKIEALRTRQDDVWGLLKEMRDRQIYTATIQQKNLGISSENNKILKNGGGIR